MSETRKKADVINPQSQEEWYYSDAVKKHFFEPANVLLEDPKEGEFDAVGEVGSPACGDIMHMWVKVDPETDRVKDLKWRTWGCASAIAATSIFSEMVLEGGGMTLDEALKITPKDIMERLSGLPANKVHCSVLADQAFHKAVEDYHKLD